MESDLEKLFIGWISRTHEEKFKPVVMLEPMLKHVIIL